MYALQALLGSIALVVAGIVILKPRHTVTTSERKRRDSPAP
jgi:hypothetical protein